MLQETAKLGLHTRQQSLAYLGSHFRAVCTASLAVATELTARAQALDAPASRSDADVGEQLLRDIVFVHLPAKHDKFNLLVLMLRKLYALVRPRAAQTRRR